MIGIAKANGMSTSRRMIIDHTSYEYQRAWRSMDMNRHNGAYYYSIEIVNNFIPNIKTDRNWITLNTPHICYDHSIVFIHNNLNPQIYEWLKEYDDLVLVCGIKETCEKVREYGTPIYVPLSVDVEEVKKHVRPKTRKTAFVGRRPKRKDTLFGDDIDIIENLERSELLSKMAEYEEIFAVGRTAIEGKILGCKILPYDERFPDPNIWVVRDNSEAVYILQKELDKIERRKHEDKTRL